MNSLIEKPKLSYIDGDVEYKINESYDAALWVWKAYSAYENGELSPLGYAAVIIERLYLDPKPSIFNEAAIKFASDYLNSFSDNDDEPRKSRIPPIDIEQDSSMIYSSLLSMGVKLRTEFVTYEDFMAYLRNLPEGSEYANIMYLRRQYYEERRKMKQKERKQLDETIERVGKNKVIINNRKLQAQAEENDRSYKEMVNAERKKVGLPPKYNI